MDSPKPRLTLCPPEDEQALSAHLTHLDGIFGDLLARIDKANLAFERLRSVLLQRHILGLVEMFSAYEKERALAVAKFQLDQEQRGAKAAPAPKGSA